MDWQARLVEFVVVEHPASHASTRTQQLLWERVSIDVRGEACASPHHNSTVDRRQNVNPLSGDCEAVFKLALVEQLCCPRHLYILEPTQPNKSAKERAKATKLLTVGSTHARTHTHTRTRTHKHTNTHTHGQRVMIQKKPSTYCIEEELLWNLIALWDILILQSPKWQGQ